MNINSNEPSFYPYSVKISKCSVSCNNIKGPYSKLCVPNVVKSINVKAFNLVPRTNETRRIEWHETCTYKFRLDAMINADVNAKNWLAREYVIKYLFEILVIVNVNVIIMPCWRIFR